MQTFLADVAELFIISNDYISSSIVFVTEASTNAPIAPYIT
jgi:hypothetical protein